MSIKTSQLEKQKIPKLRFASFDGEWKEETLGNIVDVRDGTHDSPKYHKTGYPLITSKNLMASGAINFEDVNLISTEDFVQINKRSKVDPGDILFGMIGTIGNPVIVEDDNFAIKNVALIKEKQNLKNKYLYQYLKSVYIEKQFHEKNAGGTQKFIALGVIRDLKIPLPVLVEQQKIASFLGLVDKWIENLKEQKENLELYKKAVMQKILAQEIRFKELNGGVFQEWENKKLEDICDVKGGKRIPLGYSLQIENNGFPYITVSDMENNSVSVEKIKYVPELVVEQIKNYTISTKDIFVSVAGTLGLIGIIPKELEGANLTENADKLTNLKCDQKFLFYYLQNGTLEKLISSVKTSNAQPKLAIYALKTLEIKLPSFSEQQKIADFLTSIDKVIEAKQQQISQAEEWKKGLMQQLFI